MHPDTSSNESDILFPTKKLRPPSSSSSVPSSLEDFSQVDSEGLSKATTCTTSSPKPEFDVQPASKHNKNNVSSSNSYGSKDLDNGSPVPSSTSQVSQVTHESLMYDLPPTQSPPIQVMDRSGGYDPLRIPSTVFERSKSSTPLEWSAASNESLFSLQIGNNSFSGDHVLMFGGDILKSGEIPKSGEFIKYSPTAPVPGAGTDEKSFDLEKSGATGESDDNIKVAKRETAEDRSMEKGSTAKLTWNSSNISNHSNDSARSFAFPIKKKKKKCACIPFFCCGKKCRRKCAWPLCYCSNCSCTFCYCSWPSCYLMWPSHCLRWPSCYCSNCSLAFCYCWNCSHKRWCCHSSNSTTLTEGTESNSGKAEVQKQHQEPPSPKVASKSDACNCFSRLCCRPCCCCCHCSSCC